MPPNLSARLSPLVLTHPPPLSDPLPPAHLPACALPRLPTCLAATVYRGRRGGGGQRRLVRWRRRGWFLGGIGLMAAARTMTVSSATAATATATTTATVVYDSVDDVNDDDHRAGAATMLGGGARTRRWRPRRFSGGGGGTVSVAGRAFEWGSGGAVSSFGQWEKRTVMALWGRRRSGGGDGVLGEGGTVVAAFLGRRVRCCQCRRLPPAGATAPVVMEGGNGAGVRLRWRRRRRRRRARGWETPLLASLSRRRLRGSRRRWGKREGGGGQRPTHGGRWSLRSSALWKVCGNLLLVFEFCPGTPRLTLSEEL